MILPSLNEQIRGGKLARWVHEVQTADEIWDEAEPTWVVDEETGETIRKSGYVFRNDSKPPPSQGHVDRLVGERLLPLVAEGLREFQSRAVEKPGDARALADLYHAGIEELRDVASQNPLLSGVPSVASVLDDLSSAIQRAVRSHVGAQPVVKGSSSPKAPKKRVGNPNMKSRLDGEQKARLFDDWIRLLRDDPDTYEARTPGNVSDAAKLELKGRYKVSASTVKRCIEDEKARRGA